MHPPCQKCGLQLVSPWRFCPHCGTEAAHEHLTEPASPAEKAPVRGSFSGLLFGIIVAPILLIVGTMLCLTGLGALGGRAHDHCRRLCAADGSGHRAGRAQGQMPVVRGADQQPAQPPEL